MGDLQTRFGRILGNAGFVTEGQLRRPGTEDVVAYKDADQILDVYRELGGIQQAPSIRPGAWDLEWEGIAVELDEQLHFNRYRALTLRSPLYRRLKSFPTVEYVAYCETYESECVAGGSYGKKWSNSSCEVQFGIAGEHWNLTGRGAPRWRQRAFYDFVKDLSPLLIGVPMARIAVWDELQESIGVRTVADAIRNPATKTVDVLVALVRQRAT